MQGRRGIARESQDRPAAETDRQRVTKSMTFMQQAATEIACIEAHFVVVSTN